MAAGQLVGLTWRPWGSGSAANESWIPGFMAFISGWLKSRSRKYPKLEEANSFRHAFQKLNSRNYEKCSISHVLYLKWRNSLRGSVSQSLWFPLDHILSSLNSFSLVKVCKQAFMAVLAGRRWTNIKSCVDCGPDKLVNWSITRLCQ